MDHALELLPPDYWRYYLVANAPENDDADFTWEHFQAVVNKDLADTLGNFVNRTVRFAASRFEGRVPQGGELATLERALLSELEERVRAYERHLEQLAFRKAAGELRAIWAAGNVYFARAEPWAAMKVDPERAATCIRVSLNLVRLFAILSQPVIPETGGRVLEALGVSDAEASWPGEVEAALEALPPGHVLREPPDVLFRKIADEEIALWRARFGSAATQQQSSPAPL
jgi:methionyl-tRNA synthetase